MQIHGVRHHLFYKFVLQAYLSSAKALWHIHFVLKYSFHFPRNNDYKCVQHVPDILSCRFIVFAFIYLIRRIPIISKSSSARSFCCMVLFSLESMITKLMCLVYSRYTGRKPKGNTWLVLQFISAQTAAEDSTTTTKTGTTTSRGGY